MDDSDNPTQGRVIPIRTPKPWTEADPWREAEKLMGPRQKPDVIAAEFCLRDPRKYENWRRTMLLSAKRTLRIYRYDEHHHMNPAGFRAHVHSNYETAVVNQVHDEWNMTGPRIVRAQSLHEKINRRGYALRISCSANGRYSGATASMTPPRSWPR